MKKAVWGLVLATVMGIPLVVLGRGAGHAGRASLADAATARVGRRTLETFVKATGVIKPMVGAEVKVGSRASGVVARLHVRIGDAVRKGQLLAELEARELAARRDQASAALAAARAQRDYAATDLRRKRDLAAAQLISPGDLDLAERAHAVAEQEGAEAAANLALARTQLAYARIEAPISGVVGSIATQEGETVSASLAAPTFVTLIDLARLEVWAYVDETDIGRIRLGQPARFTVDTYADEEFGGRVTAIYPQPAIRDNVVNYVTVVTFEVVRDRTLRPEMTATVRIALDSRRDVLAVPRNAVRREDGRTFVYVRDAGAIVARPVTAGVRDDGFAEVIDGLREGELVLTGRVDAVAAGPRAQ